MAYIRNLQKCNSDFAQKSRLYVRLTSHCHGDNSAASECAVTLVPEILVLGHFSP